MVTIPANIGRIWQFLLKGGRAGGSPDGWVGGGAVTNFLDRVCDNKASCKKSAHLDQKWARNGCLKFFWHFVHFSIWTLKMVAKAYTWTKWPCFQKNSYFLRLVYQIDQFFALIENPQSKIVTNAYFGHQRAAKLSHRHQKFSNGHISIKFGSNDFSFCWDLIYGLIVPHAKGIENFWKFVS